LSCQCGRDWRQAKPNCATVITSVRLIFCPDAVGLVKRMWVAPSVRGLGLGRRLLYELEDRARARGVRLMRLETKDELSEAIRMYGTSGYCEVVPFNDEPYADHWFEKALS
jgi:GNAT superfamily N-acetyltransferase